jgi:hypothetical protein
VGSIAEGLIGGFPAGAKVVLFTFFEFNWDRFVVGDGGFAHEMIEETGLQN